LWKFLVHASTWEGSALLTHTPDRQHLRFLEPGRLVADADGDADAGGTLEVVPSSLPLYSVLREDVVSSKWADAEVTVFWVVCLRNQHSPAAFFHFHPL